MSNSYGVKVVRDTFFFSLEEVQPDPDLEEWEDLEERSSLPIERQFHITYLSYHKSLILDQRKWNLM